jgi:hypothetical protein
MVSDYDFSCAARNFPAGRSDPLRVAALCAGRQKSCRAWPADLTQPRVTHRASSAGGCRHPISVAPSAPRRDASHRAHAPNGGLPSARADAGAPSDRRPTHGARRSNSNSHPARYIRGRAADRIPRHAVAAEQLQLRCLRNTGEAARQRPHIHRVLSLARKLLPACLRENGHQT